MVLDAAMVDGVFLNNDWALAWNVFNGLFVFLCAGASGLIGGGRGVSERISGGQNLQ